MPLNALLRGCRRDARIVITRFDFEYYLGKITFWTVYCNALKTTILKKRISIANVLTGILRTSLKC
jgi:hypothetical protein